MARWMLPGGSVDDANAAATDKILDLIDKEPVCGHHHILRLQNGAELARLFKIEQQPTPPGSPQKDRVQLLEQRRVRVCAAAP